ncbi:hypothetical protein DM02DRAFT_617345 [Periconia macrospinosa]|uniref:Zn(2)-C6 fungal-type domain-containing protein n=1 Tax=Periconia macrospinosa TaxID=97972 RepID=A0A2V1DF94_9PLEO|nr:hypothetical protein DM02DRAFT_617345 [Periconia macrospinosa]
MTGNLFPSRLRDSHQNRRLNTNFRRNGKLQSCEPCRKGKLKCDHMMPTCGRCQRRNRAEQCVYHPAPLTKTHQLPTPQASDSSSPTFVRQSVDIDAVPAPALPPTRIDPSPTQHPRVSRASSLPAQPWSSIQYGQQSVEELRKPVPRAHVQARAISPSGTFIHHAAILAENELSVGIFPSNGETAPAIIYRHDIQRGAACLTLLKDFPRCLRYIEKWFSFAKGLIVIEPIITIFTTGINQTWGKWLQGSDDLSYMSEKVWQNTLKPWSTSITKDTSPRDFCLAATGENLRWEVVGLVVTLIALVCASLTDGDPIFCSDDDAPIDREATLIRAQNASQMCIDFCDDFGVLTDLYLWLLYENTGVYCALRTKGSYQNLKKSATLITALLFCNLHEEIKVDEKTPFFITEVRKRLFSAVYLSDKVGAIYTGRPPRLTRQFCRLQTPLDISDAQLMSDVQDPERIAMGLDENGWNRRGAIHLSTFQRLFVSVAMITEEIVEISMDIEMPPDEIARRAADITERAIERFESLPDFLRLHRDRPFQDPKRSPIELLFLAYIEMNAHYHQYLLQRVLIKRLGADSAKLLEIAKFMFKFVLQMVNNKHVFRDFQIDFVTLLNQNGVPSAAVIAVELLRQEQNPCGIMNPAHRLPRSQTIQDLSVFVACLETIPPNSCAYISCERGLRFLKKILDTILDPVQVNEAELNMDTSLGGFDFNDPLWLDMIALEQESWPNFS